MAANYEILSGEHTVELLGATDVQDVYQVTARSLPSNVVFHVRFPPIIDDPQNISEILEIWARWYNEAAAFPGVVGIATLQNIDAAGQINDLNEITVRSASGRLTQTIEVSGNVIGTPQLEPLVEAAVAQLNALEAA